MDGFQATQTDSTTTESFKIGNYDLDHSNISSSCKSFTPKQLRYDQTRIDRGLNRIKGMFKFGEDNAEDFFREKKLKHFQSMAIQSLFVASPVWFCFFLNLFMFPYTTIYFFCKKCSCCWRKCYGNFKDENLAPEDKKNDTLRKRENVRIRERADSCLNSIRCKQITYFSNICLISIIIILTIGWSINGFRTISGLKRSDCTVTKFYTLMEHGVNDSYNGKFIGVFGFKQLLEEVKEDLQQANSNSISTSTSLQSKISALKNQMEVFYNTLKSKTIHGADPSSPSETFTPTILKDIQVGINPIVNAELNATISRMETVISGSKAANTINNNFDNVSKVLDRFIEDIEKYKSGFRDLRRLGNAAVNYEQRGTLLTGYVWINLFFTILTLGLFVYATTNSLKRRKHIKKSINCQALVTICVFLTALVFTFCGGLGIMFATVGLNVCKYTNEAFENPDIPKKLVSATMEPFLDACLYEKSKTEKTIVDALSEEDQSVFNEVIIPYVNFGTQDNTVSNSQQNLNTYIQQANQYSSQGLSPVNISYFQQALQASNSQLQCIPNQIQPTSTQCTIAPVSSASDGKTTGKSSSYCLTLKDASFTNIDDRYDGVTCDGTPISASKITDIEESYSAAKKSWDETQTLGKEIVDEATSIQSNLQQLVAEYNNMKMNLNNVFKVPVQNLGVRKIIPIHPHADLVYGREFQQFTECGKITETLSKDIVGNFCFEYMWSFGNQAIWMAVLSVFMTIFGVCAYLSVMQIDLKAKRSIKHGAYSKAVVMPKSFFSDYPLKPSEKLEKKWGTIQNNVSRKENQLEMKKSMNFIQIKKRKSVVSKYNKAQLQDNKEGFNFDDSDSDNDMKLNYDKLPPLKKKPLVKSKKIVEKKNSKDNSGKFFVKENLLTFEFSRCD